MVGVVGGVRGLHPNKGKNCPMTLNFFVCLCLPIHWVVN